MFIPNIFSLRKYELRLALTKRNHLFKLENMLLNLFIMIATRNRNMTLQQ